MESGRRVSGAPAGQVPLPVSGGGDFLAAVIWLQKGARPWPQPGAPQTSIERH